MTADVKTPSVHQQRLAVLESIERLERELATAKTAYGRAEQKRRAASDAAANAYDHLDAIRNRLGEARNRLAALVRGES